MRMRRNAAYGLLGFVIPTVVVLAAYPILIRELGADAFGIYLLATSMNGVLSFLDFGFSAATVQFVAGDMARSDKLSVGEVLATSLAFYGTVGMGGALLIYALSPWLVTVLAIAPSMRDTAIAVFQIAALQFAVFFLITVYLSFFKGMHRFDLSTLALAILSALTYGGAVLGLKFAGVGLVGVTLISLTANLGVLTFAAVMTARLCRSAGLPVGLARPTISAMRRMFGFGMFVAVEKTALIVANQGLRLVIGAFLGPAAVTVFVTAFTITSKVAAALRATFEVIMPTTAKLVYEGGEGNLRKLRRIYLKAGAVSTLVASVGMALLYFNASGLVAWWLRSSVSGEVASLVQVLCVGFAVSGVTVVTYHMIAGIGRPVVNAAAAILEPVLVYGLIGILAVDGLTTYDFAVALSVDLVVHAVFYVTFCEVVVWRRWVPKLMRRRGVEIAATL